jgi:tetratricopeptide (TPR) repeat protein
MEAAEIARARGKRPDSLDAYDCYMRALPYIHAQDQPGNDEAMRLLRRAIKLDANFATPYGLLSWCYSLRRSQGWAADYEAEKQEAVRLARAAARLGKDDSMALHLAGLCLSHFLREHDEAMALIDAALQLNPSSAGAWARGGWVRCFRGEPEEAMRYFEQSMRLNPRDPFPYLNYAGAAWACALADRNEEAVGWATKAVRDNPNYITGFRYLAFAYVQLGRIEEARATMRRVLELDPTLTAAIYRQRLPLVGPMAERFFNALRTAGLPE